VPIEGELNVVLRWDGQSVTGVDVRSTRPFAAARILARRTTAAAAATVPMLFSVCGGAQRAAAVSALAAAGAADVDADAVRDSNGVALETIQEHVWRLLIDWPQAMGRAPNATPVAAVRHRIAAAARTADGRGTLGDPAAMRNLGAELSGLAAQAIYGMPPAAWVDLATAEALDAWTARAATPCATLLHAMQAEMPALGRSAVRLMPAPTRGALLRVVVPAQDGDPDFERAPTWEGAPVETGALARTARHPIVSALILRNGHAAATRYVARLVDLAWALRGICQGSHDDSERPWVQAFAVGKAEGCAAVQTARGLLVHRVRVESGRVVDYRIVAPTEWNFHPRGALASGLAGLPAGSRRELQTHARIAVQALDPCVPCRLEVADA
jgi:Ni,Fe-hydrogenase I large subunit